MKVLTQILLILSVLGASPSWACSYDGQFINPFTESYPGSLDVVIATQKALANNQIVKPKNVEGAQGLQRAVWWLKLFVKNNQEVLPEEGYIYLADSHLWSKFTKMGKVEVHALAPQDNKHVLVISEYALSNLISKNISYEQSQQLGLVEHNY